MMSRSQFIRLTILFLCSACATLAWGAEDPKPAAKKKTLLLVCGKKSHGPDGNGIHDYAWSGKLLKVLLKRSNIASQIVVDLHLDGWPSDSAAVQRADSIMVVSDGRDGDRFTEAEHLATPERVLEMEQAMKRGCGFVTFHFSTFAPDAYGEQMLHWNGAYFDWETDGKREWYSAITTVEADVELPSPDHPVVRGVKPFRMNEEFYYNLRFAPVESAPVPILKVPALPGREPDGKWVAWGFERPDGGRSFGTTCGHFYDNWRADDFRRLILNAIAWTAHIEVPPGGVESNFIDHAEITTALE